MKNLLITINGSPGTGKSTIAHIINTLLCMQGFETELIDDELMDPRNLTKRIKSLTESTNIKIVVQDSLRL